MTFLLGLITMSAVGTFVLLILFSLRPITQKLFSKTWHYYTSLIPVFLFLGGAGLINSAIQFVRLRFESAGADMAQLTSYLPPLQNGFPETVMQYSQTVPAAVNTPSFIEQLLTSSVDFVREFAVLFALVWAIGAILFVAVNVIKYQKYRRVLLQNSRRCFDISCAVKVRISSRTNTPLLIGFLKPVIVLPSMKFSQKELDLILSHELTHFRRKDVWLKFIVLLVNAAHWFNPAAYILNRQINTLCELACDEKVVRKLDEQGRKFYGEIILGLLRQGTVQRSLICTSGLCSSKKNVKNRLSNIISVRKTKKSIIALSLIATMTILMFGGVAAAMIDFTLPERVSGESEVESEDYISDEEYLYVTEPIYSTEPETAENDYISVPVQSAEMRAVRVAETENVAPVETENNMPSVELTDETQEDAYVEMAARSTSAQRIEDIIASQIIELRRDLEYE